MQFQPCFHKILPNLGKVDFIKPLYVPVMDDVNSNNPFILRERIFLNKKKKTLVSCNYILYLFQLGLVDYL